MYLLSAIFVLFNFVSIVSNESIENLNGNNETSSRTKILENSLLLEKRSPGSKEDEVYKILTSTDINGFGLKSSEKKINVTSKSSESIENVKEIDERQVGDSALPPPINADSDFPIPEPFENAENDPSNDSIVFPPNSTTAEPIFIIEPVFNISNGENSEGQTHTETTTSSSQNESGKHNSITVVRMPPLNPTAPENIIKPTDSEKPMERVHIAPLIGYNETSDSNITHAAHRSNSAHSYSLSSSSFISFILLLTFYFI